MEEVIIYTDGACSGNPGPGGWGTILMYKDNKKEIEVINGDGSNLDISPVYEHINAAKPKSKDKNPKNIIIPDEKKIEKK